MVTIILAKEDQKEIISNLMQYYFYDFTEYNGADVEENGMFGNYPFLDEYWNDEKNHFPYLLEYNEKFIGFVLVKKVQETSEKDYYTIAEFFILKKYRRDRHGSKVAKSIFNLFQGDWTVHQIEKNIPAQLFWKKVIGEYTNNQFTLKQANGRVYQVFNNRLNEINSIM